MCEAQVQLDTTQTVFRILSILLQLALHVLSLHVCEEHVRINEESVLGSVLLFLYSPIRTIRTRL